MQKRSDDCLIAYLDGEVDASERREIEGWLDTDPTARDKLAALAESAALVRSAFDEVVHEPVPDRLIAAARGEKLSAERRANILPFKRGRSPGGAPAGRSWWLGLPLAASLCGLLLGGSVAYLSVAKLLPGALEGKQPASGEGDWAAPPTRASGFHVAPASLPIAERILISLFVFGIIGLFTFVGVVTPGRAFAALDKMRMAGT